jgi:hypothetical protein
MMFYMLEIYSHDQEKNEFFLFLFLQRLSSELRVLIGENFSEMLFFAAARHLLAFLSSRQLVDPCSHPTCGSDR